MGNTYMPKPENRYPNNVSGFEHIWELDMLRARWAASQADHISETKGLQLFLQTDRYMGGYFNEFLPHSDVCLLSNWFSYIGIYYILGI